LYDIYHYCEGYVMPLVFTNLIKLMMKTKGLNKNSTLFKHDFILFFYRAKLYNKKRRLEKIQVKKT